MNRKIRIILTGGGSGGHVYPLIAVADEIIKIQKDRVIIAYAGPKHFLNEEFEKRGIKTYKIASSKLRRYFDFRNFLDIPKFFWGLIQAFFWLYFLMPDIIFSKGGPGALPVILAARFYLIPVVIHDSDSIPGLTSRLSVVFAKKIFIAFKSTTSYFPEKKTELVGNPVRAELFLNRPPDPTVAKSILKFNAQEPLILIIAGSQGATRINSFVFDNLEEMLKIGQILHMVGEKNISDVPDFKKEKYQFKGFLNSEELKIALAAADIVISRASAGAIFEIASFGKPSILIPLKEAASDHQRVNAYEYARGGAAVIIEESNLGFGILKNEMEKILKNPKIKEEMSLKAKNFAKPEASEVIAKRILEFIKI